VARGDETREAARGDEHRRRAREAGRGEVTYHNTLFLISLNF
jgi:hypothetical protein